MRTMIRSKLSVTSAVLIGSVTMFVSLERAASAHDAPHFSAGEPGDPKKPARAVLITMREGDGKMLFVPDRIEVRRHEQIRFMLTNVGFLDHEFVLATVEENLKHAEEMKKNPDMEHDDPNGKRVAPKKKAEIVWKFTKAGEFEYGCLIPGHREAGMFGKVVVK
jgi:uncharacterized cupredoxin-like copper-binding protein